MRALALVALGGAAAFALAPAANATHLCVTSGSQTVYCAPHPAIEQPRQICVSSGSQQIVCVF